MSSSTLNFRRFVQGLVFISILLGLVSAYAYFSLSYLAPQASVQWIHEYIVEKDRIAIEKSCEGAKILILAGSSGLYGTSAQMIEESLGIPTVNFATCTTMGDYIYERAKRVLNPGDIVLMPLEYGYYAEYKDKVMFERQQLKARYVMKYDPQYFKGLSLIKRMNYVLIGARDIKENIDFMGEDPGVGWTAKNVNEWGDTVNNKELVNFTEIMIEFPNNFNLFFPAQGYETVQDILEFSRWCRENGILLIASYPPALHFDEYDTPLYRKSFSLIEEFYENNGIETVCSPQDFFYEREMFYNTDYHLNFEGRRIRTEKMIERLKEII